VALRPVGLRAASNPYPRFIDSAAIDA